MGKSKINDFMKHKRLIIIGLILIGFLILIITFYMLTFINNKPVLFGDKKNKVSKSSKYFDFTVIASEIKLKNDSVNGSIKCSGVISNLKEDIKNVSVEFEVHTNWTNETDYANTKTFKIESGNTLKSSTTTQYVSDTCTLQIDDDYPYKVKGVPFVKINHPTIYAKVTYTRVKPTSLSEEDRTETLYFKIPYSEYCTDVTPVK